MIKTLVLGLFVTLACITGLRAHPLAVTEVMSSASGSFPDWWELTNLSTNNIDLTGYSWRDDSAPGFIGATNAQFAGVIIHPNESVIFCETKGAAGGTAGVATAEDFRTWWGISPSVQVIIVGINPGLGSGGDSVRLWSTNWAALGANTNGLDLNNAPEYLVDRVDTSAATQGFSLYYNTNNGKFDISSASGVNGAFTAVYGGDVGSPGVALNIPAPVVIAQQPTNQIVNLGGTASFTISAYGLPKPRFQWLFNAQPIDTNQMTATFTVSGNYCFSTVTITNAQVLDGGTFRAVVTTNGVQTSVSSNAVLTVNTDPLAPFFTAKPGARLYAYPGQTVTFRANAFGSPPPDFHWQFNSNTIAGETDPQYVFNVYDTNQSGIYTVTATNSSGATNASVLLTVTPKPNLHITEVCSAEATNAAGSTEGHNDWWELSNLGDFPVNLQGYRFDDNSFLIGAAYAITNELVIAPGESIVFAEDMTPDMFRAWWGAQNLRTGLQIINYHGSALSFSATAGDSLTLWNAAAATEGDFIDSVSMAVNPATYSFGFDPVNRIFLGTTPDGYSAPGVNGAFAAAFNGVTPDIGSPGTIINVPHFTSITKTNPGVALTWFTQPNWTNHLEYKESLTDTNWTPLASPASDSTTSMNFIDTTSSTQRFYRINLNP